MLIKYALQAILWSNNAHRQGYPAEAGSGSGIIREPYGEGVEEDSLETYPLGPLPLVLPLEGW